MARRPEIRTELPGPRAVEIIQTSERYVSSSYTRDYPLVAARGEGVWITDVDGNTFLDMTAGIAVTSTGHCHPEVVRVIREQAGNLLHMSGTDFYYPSQAELASKLCERVPVKGGRARVYFCNSGTEAVEAAMKLARWKTGRPGFVAFLGAFHGRTMGSLSLTASKAIQKKGFGPFLGNVIHSVYPDPYRHGGPERASRMALEHLERLFATLAPPQDIAAVVCEPIQGEGGYLFPPDTFLHGLRELCDQHGILLVFDEVQCGMGRTGKLWACQHSGVEPDILTAAKGIASGLPLGATFASDEVMQWPPGAHASTFGGNPVSCVAAIKTLELLEGGLIDNAATVGAHLLADLQARLTGHRHVGEVRGRGLMVCVEIVEDRISRKRDPVRRHTIVDACFHRGLLVLPCGPNSVRFCPSLVVDREEASLAAEILASVVDEL